MFLISDCLMPKSHDVLWRLKQVKKSNDIDWSLSNYRVAWHTLVSGKIYWVFEAHGLCLCVDEWLTTDHMTDGLLLSESSQTTCNQAPMKLLDDPCRLVLLCTHCHGSSMKHLYKPCYLILVNSLQWWFITTLDHQWSNWMIHPA